MADDSGLVVDALDGAPGIYSSRYAGKDAKADDNNKKLLSKMAALKDSDRSARFVCALVFIDDDGTETVALGECRGRIGYEPRGNKGFGYDPLFIIEQGGHEQTLAQLSAEEKNALSHRCDALQKLKKALLETSHQQEIVAFDFDGTLIDASSPVRLITRLSKRRIMPKLSVLKIMLWGLRYKMGKELDQAKPRRYIFASFRNLRAHDANAIMKSVYHEELQRLLRPGALSALRAHQRAGREVIIVSASFDPIISEVCIDLNIKHYICTQMEVAKGSYTGATLGPPPESTQKLMQFRAWANETFGHDGWKLAYAYGDHFSDVPLMETAQYPVAVDPDRRLEGIAKERGWAIETWPLGT